MQPIRVYTVLHRTYFSFTNYISPALLRFLCPARHQVWDEKKMQQPGFLGQCEVDLESIKVERPNSKSPVDPRCIVTEECTKQLKSRVMSGLEI